MTCTGSILISRYCYLLENVIITYTNTMADRGKFLPHKFFNLVRILFLSKHCALSHMYCIHIIATKTNNFLFNFELSQVCNYIYNNSRCFTFSRMNLQRFFIYFMNRMKKNYWNSLIFLSVAFNDCGVILGSFNCFWWSFDHKANTLATTISGFKCVQENV